MLKNTTIWIVFGLILGMALGGSFVSSSLMNARSCVQSSHPPITAAAENNQRPNYGECKTWLKRILDWFFHDVTGIATLLLVTITGGLVFATARLVAGAEDQLAHNQRVERAYVKMSHTESLSPRTIGDGDFITIAFEIKNFGQTPARISDVLVRIESVSSEHGFGPIPDYEIYKHHRAAKGFLVTNDWFRHQYAGDPGDFASAQAMIDAARDGSYLLRVYGYVDYVDIFGYRHRAGYGREFNRLVDELVFIPSEAFNYDRPRVPGEGNDW